MISIEEQMPSGGVSLAFVGKIRTGYINGDVIGGGRGLKAMGLDGITPDERLIPQSMWCEQQDVPQLKLRPGGRLALG